MRILNETEIEQIRSYHARGLSKFWISTKMGIKSGLVENALEEEIKKDRFQ